MTATTFSYPFKTMNFGNVTVNRPHIVIVPDQMYKQTDLILGEGILRQLHMYIAYKEKKLYLTPAHWREKARRAELAGAGVRPVCNCTKFSMPICSNQAQLGLQPVDMLFFALQDIARTIRGCDNP